MTSTTPAVPESVHGGPLRVVLLMGEAVGGIAGHVASLGADLAAAGVRVRIATTADSAAVLPAQAPHTEVLWPRKGGSLRALRRHLAGTDIVHAHGHQAGALAVAICRTLRPRPRVVITWHNALLAGGAQAAAGAALERVQVRGADLVTGASSDLVARARQVGAANAELSMVAAPDLTPWAGNRDQARTELAAELTISADVPWVLTISRIAPQKNLPVLVDAAAQLTTPALWLVAGSGDLDLQAQLRDRIRSSGAPVRLLGSRKDVPRLIAAADVLALPSQWEARSLVVQEALVGGLPCVVSDSGGLPDLVGDAGLLVPVGDAATLATTVDRVLTDPDLAERMRTDGRARGAALTRAHDVLTYWLSRYQELLGAR